MAIATSALATLVLIHFQPTFLLKVTHKIEKVFDLMEKEEKDRILPPCKVFLSFFSNPQLPSPVRRLSMASNCCRSGLGVTSTTPSAPGPSIRLSSI